MTTNRTSHRFTKRMYRSATKAYDDYVVNRNSHLGRKQRAYQEIVFGTLIYTVVIGFFDDYTPLLSTSSYSVTFFVAFALALLTFFTQSLKIRAISYVMKNASLSSKLGLVSGVWFVSFLSKFVVVELLDIIFRTSLVISDFLGLGIIVVTMTFARTAFDFGFKKLADK